MVILEHVDIMRRLFTLAILLVSLPSTSFARDGLPVDKGVVTSGVGWRLDPFGSGKVTFHRGIDIAVPVGTPVRATRKGQVIFAGNRSGYGATVIVEHSNGDRTLYGHNSLVRVSPGERVVAGTVLAFSGNSGRSTGPHVHFEQIASGRPVMDMEDADKEKSSDMKVADSRNQRDQMEQKMDESVNSIMRTLNRFNRVSQGG